MSQTTQAAVDDQVAWVFDLNKCMGCPTCSVACHDLWMAEDMRDQWWCTVTTKPGEGHPKGWIDMGGGYDDDGNLVLGDRPSESEVHDQVERSWDPNEATSGDRPEIAPESSPEWTFNWEEDEGGGEHPNSWQFYLPKLCMQCSKAPCLEACPEDAIEKREEDGIVLIDEDACDGNRYCQRACPYKVIWFNEERGAADSGTSQMCIGCVPRLEDGVAPACARACPGRVVHFGSLTDEETSVHRLVREWGVALPLLPERNTSPNVFYVPPMSSPKLDEEGRFTDENRIPLEYLESLFGDEVGDVLETLREERKKVKEGGESELIDTLIGYRWPDDFFGSYTTHPDEVVAAGD